MRIVAYDRKGVFTVKKLNDLLIKLLKTDSRYFTGEGELLKNAVYEDAMKMTPSLIKLLLSDDNCRARFFTEVDGVLVFDKVGFGWVINNRQFLPDSYTRYKNKIGLTDSNGDFISSSNDVVLSFPYKDCVLEFDSTDENEKRTEVFYNENLCSDDIDHLFHRKVFTNAQRHTASGVESITAFNGENLVIKGNNLLSLYSLLVSYSGKIKCMYWDILYNTNSDQVPYNDSFKHSSWLTMMKNRLEVAKRLLSNDGVICLQCDDNEMAYLKVLCDEIFGRDNHINTICVKMSELKGFKMGNLQNKFPKLKEFILVYAVNKSMIELKIETKLKDNLEAYTRYYNKRIINIDKDCSEWKTESVSSDFDKIAHANEMIYLVTRDSKVKEPLPLNKFYKLTNDSGKTSYLYYDGTKVNTVLFLSEYIKEPVGDIWMDISTININKESTVQLPNGKKPESLLRRIIYAFTDENDYVLDAYFGTGTTGAVALKMNRKFIGFEQLDSHYEKSKRRLTEVISGDSSGISSEVGWRGGGSFVSLELKTLNQSFVEKIQSAETDEKLISILAEIKESGFISSNVKPSEIDPEAEDFKALSFDDKKRLLLALLDKNMLYVNYCDIDDESYGVSEADKAFTHSFYKES